MPALIHSFILETCIAPLQSRDYYTQRLSQPMQTHAVTDKEEGLQRDIKFGSNTITSNMIIININEDKGQWRSLFIHSFIHSFIPAISIAPLQVLYYSEALPTTARILYRCSQATAGNGLAQGPYEAARAGVEPTTLRLKVIVSTKAPPRPTY